MIRRILPGICCLALVGIGFWRGVGDDRMAAAWVEVAPGVLRTPGYPHGYALIDGANALLIDAPRNAEGLKAAGVKKIEQVLLTHHHHDTCAAADTFLAAKVPVRAPKLSAKWLTPENVSKYWADSIPMRSSGNAAYLVLPVGLDGVDCSLDDGQEIAWHGWSIKAVATPGHTRDHFAFAARKGKDGKLLVFSGDALAQSGKLWTPFSTDWDHWTDLGLKPTAASLRKLADLKPAALLPAHGVPIVADTVTALTRTAEAVEEMAFLKSFERFTKERLGKEPKYNYLAPDQVKSIGALPWTKVSDHLFLTGNTYVLKSRDGPFLVVDPFGPRIAEQIATVKKAEKLGDMEVILFSHAHNDHYNGVHALPDRDRFKVWTLDAIAGAIADPYVLRAPFLDPRPVKIDRRLKDGETAMWREYKLVFHFFPGQSEFTMAVETTIDGKKCLFTADNFFHQDMFSGSGGWMGLNRSFPPRYAQSAQKVLDLAPEWVLAEHGGPFEFSAEDFKRRVRWGQVSGEAADALSVSGSHRRDWDPNRLTVQPLLVKAAPGAKVKAELVAANLQRRPDKVTMRLLGRGVFPDQVLTLDPQAGTARKEFTLQLGDKIAPGRHIFILRSDDDKSPDGSDAFLAIEVGPAAPPAPKSDDKHED